MSPGEQTWLWDHRSWENSPSVQQCHTDLPEGNDATIKLSSGSCSLLRFSKRAQSPTMCTGLEGVNALSDRVHIKMTPMEDLKNPCPPSFHSFPLSSRDISTILVSQNDDPHYGVHIMAARCSVPNLGTDRGPQAVSGLLELLVCSVSRNYC